MPTFEKVFHWLPWCVGVCAGMLFLPYTWPFLPLFCAVLCLTSAALVGMVRAVMQSNRSGGKYDLSLLKRVHETEELRRLHEEEPILEPDQVLCLQCGEVHDARLPGCPNCRRS
jgi:hypothetical protein